MAVSARKIKLFQSSIQFLGYNIDKGTISPINRVLSFADKFPDEIRDKKQLQRFLGCLNCVADFYENLAEDRKLLQKRLRKKPIEWSKALTRSVKRIKEKVKILPCLSIVDPNTYKIVETDASDIGYGGILKQSHNKKTEKLVEFTSSTWNDTQKNYSTIKKEILSIV